MENNENQIIKSVELKYNGDVYFNFQAESKLAKKYGQEYKVKSNIVKIGKTACGQDVNYLIYLIDESGNVWYTYSSMYYNENDLKILKVENLKNIVDFESIAYDNAISAVPLDIDGNRYLDWDVK